MAENREQVPREAVDAVVNSIGFFVMPAPVVQEMANDVKRAKSSASSIVPLFAEFLGGLQIPGPLPVDTQKQQKEVIKDFSIAETKSRAFDLAQLGLIIPLLLNQTSRDYLTSFITGLIGVEAVESITKALKVVGVVLAGVFAVKLFKQVSDTITAFTRLSSLVGALFTLSQEEKDLDIEDATRKERGSWEKRKEKYEKNKSEHRKKRLGKLVRARRLRKVLRALGQLSKLTGIGLIVGAAADAFVDTIFDYFTKDEEKATDPVFPVTENEPEERLPEPEDDQESIATTILKKFISNLTFGIVSPETVDKAFKRITSFFGVKPKEAPVPVQPAPIVSGLSEQQAVEARSAAAMIDPRRVDNPQSGTAIEPMATPSSQGAALGSNSETVIGVKKDLQQSMNVINNVDNSTIIVAPAENTVDFGSVSYTSTVGA